MILLARHLIERQGFLYRVRNLLRVPRIDNYRAVQALCGASKLAENHHAVATLVRRRRQRPRTLRGDVFVRNEIHAITRAADKTCVRDGVERAELVKRQRLVHEVYGHEVDGAETAVDAAHELVDGTAKILVLFNVLTRGYCELNEDDLCCEMCISSGDWS